MTLPDVSVGQGHVDAHNAERHSLNALETSLAGKQNNIYFMPETYGAVGDGVVDDTAAIQAAIDAASAAGGGIVLLSKTYGFASDITQKNTVTVQGIGIAGPAVALSGLKAVGPGARYRFGNFTGNPYPGPLKNIQINGNNIGGTTELLRCEAVETSLYDVHVMNSAADGVNMTGSQNVNLFNPNFGSCPNGVALLYKAVAGQQPAGHVIVYGGHIGDSLVCLQVTAPDGAYFIGPHDNYFYGTIFETGRTAGKPITAVALLEDGDTTFDGCVFTIGAQKTAITADAAIVIRNALHTGFSTTAVFHNCDIGGGVGSLKANDGVRVEGGHAFNQVHYSGRTAVSGMNYMHCHDGGDCLVTVDGVVVQITTILSQFRTINGGALAGILKRTQVPVLFETPPGTNFPVAIKQNGDVSNRLQISPLGVLQWLDGATAQLRATLQRAAGNIMSFGGVWQFLNGYGRFYTTSTVSAPGQTVTIDAAAASYQFLSFTANGASITTLNITNGYEGAELRIGIFGTGTNTIAWPAATVVVPRITLPQPIAGVVQFIDLTYISGKWYELNRSQRRGEKRINAQAGTNYQPSLSDAEVDVLVTMSNAAPSTLTIPTYATVPFPIGSQIDVAQQGAGQVTITPAAGVTINGTPGLKIAAQYGFVSLVNVGTDSWLVTGRLAA